MSDILDREKREALKAILMVAQVIAMSGQSTTPLKLACKTVRWATPALEQLARKAVADALGPVEGKPSREQYQRALEKAHDDVASGRWPVKQPP